MFIYDGCQSDFVFLQRQTCPINIAMTARIAIIGNGTAGSLAVTHFFRYSDCEITWYYDPAIPPQAVGEGSNLVMPRALQANLGFYHQDLDKINGTMKHGILKSGWGNGHDFFHGFMPPHTGYHFNALGLQKYILDRLSSEPRIKIVEKNVTADQVDSDFVMDCSGRPSDYTEYNLLDSIPVNSVYVNQCFWDHPQFNYTLTIARPYGWVFGIPLQNRCSIGYLYNNTINTLEEVQEDIQNIFEQYNLTPSTTTNAFTFKNYYRQQNFTDRIAYNGNASFFLEPLEATSISTMDGIQRRAFDLWSGVKTVEQVNQEYTDLLKEIENVIMLHYYAGSVYNTDFWNMAVERGRINFEQTRTNPKFNQMIEMSKQYKHGDNYQQDYGSWGVNAFYQNFTNLGLYK
jgi:hypothetical protein